MSLPPLFAGNRRIRFSLLVANGVAQAVLTVATAILVQRSFDSLVLSTATTSGWDVAFFGLALLAVIGASAWLRWRGHVDAEVLGQDYVHAVRKRLFRHLTRIGADGARHMSKGALMLRFVGDLTALRQWISLGLARLTVSGLAAALTIAALGIVEPVIAIAVAMAIAVMAGFALATGPRLRIKTREARRRRGRLAAMLNDRLSRIAVVEAYGQEHRERRRFDGLSTGVRRAMIGQARVVGLLRAVSEAGTSFACLCALFVGAILVSAGQAEPGAVVAAMVVSGLLAPRLQDLGRVYEYWNAALIARQKQEELLALKPAGRTSSRRKRRQALAPGPGCIELSKIRRNRVIRQLDLRIEPGSRVCVVGPNGAGKSTLLRTIAGILQPDKGKVLVDGQDLARCRWQDVRRAFAIVAPDLPLLRGTIRHNLTYGADNPSEEELREVIARCDLEPLITRVPKGLRARLSENGEALSTGERARLLLARAVLARPRVLLLDEAEANLDAGAVQALDRIIDSFDGTVVFVTHDAARTARADQVLHLDGGCLVAWGATDEVMAPGTATRSLFVAPLRAVS